MKLITKLLLSLCLIVGLGAALTINAQIQSNTTIKADIPYPFMVNNKMLPAGKYLIRVADGFPNLNMLEIRSATRKTIVLFDTQPIDLAGPARHSELVFDKIGDTYFLSRVQVQGDNGGNQVRESRMERRLEEAGEIPAQSALEASRVSGK